jgi:prepilin-type N-terminal cleavage/methylation domain-containing protein/prepilin-type processing-associated H-X9-DG protein
MSGFWHIDDVLPQTSTPSRNTQVKAFTLVELLATISIIAILAGLLIPALAKAKSKSQRVVCASNMKNWATATQLYASDYNETLPPFGDASMDYTQPFWHTKLAPYLSRKIEQSQLFRDTSIFHDELRRCPAGHLEKVNSSASAASTNSAVWNCWIGANFGLSGDKLTGAFYYANMAPPVKLSRIPHPCDAMSFMDTISHYVYSPVENRYRFALDLDNDGAPDTTILHPDTPYNCAQPRVHNDGANLTLLDGHVERVPFKSLWKIDSDLRVTHSFWYLED